MYIRERRNDIKSDKKTNGKTDRQTKIQLRFLVDDEGGCSRMLQEPSGSRNIGAANGEI